MRLQTPAELSLPTAWLVDYLNVIHVLSVQVSGTVGGSFFQCHYFVPVFTTSAIAIAVVCVDIISLLYLVVVAVIVVISAATAVVVVVVVIVNRGAETKTGSLEITLW